MKLFEKKKKEGCEGAAVARSPGHRKAGVVVVMGGGLKKKGVLAVIGPQESSPTTTRAGDKRRPCDGGKE